MGSGINPWGIIILIVVVRIIEVLALGGTPAAVVFDGAQIAYDIFSLPPDFTSLVAFFGFLALGITPGMPLPFAIILSIATGGPLFYALFELFRGN